MISASSPALAQTADKDSLRGAVRLPKIIFRAQNGFASLDDLCARKDKSNPRTEIAHLEKDIAEGKRGVQQYVRLAELYAETKEEVHFREATVKATALCHQLQAGADSGLVLSRLGKVLAAAGHDEEAKSLLRQAVHVSPREWRCWVALGVYLQASAMRMLFKPHVQLKAEVSFPQQVRLLSGKKLPPEQVAEVLKLLDEARECLNRAVEAASNQAEPYARRGAVIVWQCAMRACLHSAQEEEGDPERVFFSSEALPDFHRAARLSPADVPTLGTVAWFAARCSTLNGGSGHSGGYGTEEAKEVAHEALARLEKLVKNSDLRIAAASAEVLALFYAGVGIDQARAEKFLRQAVALDPSRESAWEMLVILLVSSDRFQDLREVCKERLQHRNSAPTRFLLAKAHERLNQPKEAEGQLRIALNRDSRDFLATLGLAALLLKRSKDDRAFIEAESLLLRAGQLLTKDSPPEQRLDYLAVQAIYLALSGDITHAREGFRAVLRSDPDHPVAREAERALGE